jgi:hydrogenase maturation factor
MPDPVCHADAIEGCITCGDVAVEMNVVAVDSERGLALSASAGGERESVEIALLAPEPVPGDRILVHAGTAIARLDDGEPEPETSMAGRHMPGREAAKVAG